MVSDVLVLPNMIDKRKSTIKMKNRIFAIEAAPAATPPKPNIAAIIATTRNITVQRNIAQLFRFIIFVSSYTPY